MPAPSQTRELRRGSQHAPFRESLDCEPCGELTPHERWHPLALWKCCECGHARKPPKPDGAA